MFNKWKNSVSEVWRISWPLIIANSFWNLQVTVDRIYLGQYSTEALGAAIAAVGLFWAPMALVQQTAAYVTTFIAQYSGAKQSHWIGPSVWQSIYVSVVGGLLFLLLIPITPWIFTMVGHSPKMQEMEIDYFIALTYSALPTALVAAASGFFTGLGNSKMIMMINGVGLLFNIVLDYLLIFGKMGFPAMGVYGAGVATAIANYGAAFFGFYLVFNQKYEELYKIKSSWKPNFELMSRYIKFGLPSGLQWALEGMAFTVFLIFIGRLPNGDAALAASGITVTINMLAILPPLGVAQGVSVLVGQYLGENNIAKAVRSTWAGLQLSWIYIGLSAVCFLLFPQLFLALFKNSENEAMWSEVSRIVPVLLIFVVVYMFFDAMNLIFSFTLKGAGDTRFVSLIALTIPWPIMILPTWYVSQWESGLYWAWGAASVFVVVQALIFLMRFRGGRWKSMRVF